MKGVLKILSMTKTLFLEYLETMEYEEHGEHK